MAAVVADLDARQRAALGIWLAALCRSRVSKIAVCTVAAGACLFRLLHVAALFVAQ
jgi:hypothetical protein